MLIIHLIFTFLLRTSAERKIMRKRMITIRIPVVVSLEDIQIILTMPRGGVMGSAKDRRSKWPLLVRLLAAGLMLFSVGMIWECDVPTGSARGFGANAGRAFDEPRGVCLSRAVPPSFHTQSFDASSTR